LNNTSSCNALVFFRLFLVSVGLFSSLQAIKIKEVTNILGVRDNQLIGYGLIVGLDGTGDSSSPFTNQTLASMLQGVNIKISPSAIKSKNIASVVVTASLPPFIRQGDKIDITVSSIGDAKSLKGGTLIITPLKGLDGQIYAIAQGILNMKSGGAGMPDTVAKISRGAIVEREVGDPLLNSKNITLTLKHSSFTNANEIQSAINASFQSNIANAIDSRTIKLIKPSKLSSVEFISTLENIVVSYNVLDKIVIDSTSGTIIAGLNVEVEPVLVTHRDITVQIESTFVLVPSDNDIGDGVLVDKEENIITTTRKPTVAGVARALQKMGATPKDIISIFTAMRKSGAIVVDIEVI